MDSSKIGKKSTTMSDPKSNGSSSSSSKGSIDELLNSGLEKCKQPEISEEELRDCSDPICGICELGGEMICCDGGCLRSFHPVRFFRYSTGV